MSTVGAILRSLKEEVPPCEDFSEFVCGGWRGEHPIPEGRYRWGVFDVLDEQTLLHIKGETTSCQLLVNATGFIPEKVANMSRHM